MHLLSNDHFVNKLVIKFFLILQFTAVTFKWIKLISTGVAKRKVFIAENTDVL